MIDILCPDECVESVVQIDLDALWQKGLRALILDLDNTLLAWEADHIPADVREWVDSAKARGFKVCIASNGTSGRVMRIAESLDVPAIPKAIKPRKRPFRRALEILGVEPHQAAVVGDQIFTDVLGGNRMELYTILNNPMSAEELRTTKIVRRVERRVLSRLHKKGLLRDEQLATRGLESVSGRRG